MNEGWPGEASGPMVQREQQHPSATEPQEMRRFYVTPRGHVVHLPHASGDKTLCGVTIPDGAALIVGTTLPECMNCCRKEAQ